MKTYSQSKQDLFAKLVNQGRPGFFLDIGCSSPEFQSNTKLLIEDGWSGVGVDSQDFSEEWKAHPRVEFLKHDASNVNWDRMVLPSLIDYASVDVDAGTFAALRNLLECRVKMKCATVEHDAYRFGDALRHRQRLLMDLSGYAIVRRDVEHSGMAYEDWYVNREIGAVAIQEISQEVASW